MIRSWQPLGLLMLFTAGGFLHGQELEPRSYVNLPVGMNFVVAGYGYSTGDVLFDSASLIQNGEISSHLSVLAYARVINLWGDSGKIEFVAPYAWTSGSATFAGVPSSRSVNGFADPSVKLTWNFIGAPAMRLPEFAGHTSDWVMGASFRVGMPLGKYDENRVLNIGANRWSFKPEVGTSKNWGRWSFEASTGVTFFTDNEEFFGAQEREQDPLFSVQGHVIYQIGKGIWAAFDATYYDGGMTTVGGTINDDRQSNSRLGLTLGLPLSRHQSIKLYASTGATARIGGNFTSGGILWQYRWGGGLGEAPPVPAPASSE